VLSLRSTVWYYLPRAFPILIAGAGIYYAYRSKSGSEGRERVQSTVFVGFAAVAFVMLLKMVLATRLYHYGFVLAFPATILVTVLLLETIPKALSRGYGGGAMFREAAYSAIAVFSMFYVAMSLTSYRERSLEIETARGRILWWDPSFSSAGIGFSHVVDLLATHVEEGSTLVSLPDAAGINYVTGLVNPTPYISIVPPELAAFGEEKILAALRKASPDYVLVSHRSLAGFGMGRFAEDAPLARELLTWVHSSYEPIGRVEAEIHRDLLDQSFTLYRRRRWDSLAQPALSTDPERSLTGLIPQLDPKGPMQDEAHRDASGGPRWLTRMSVPWPSRSR
jgi:hypothetical protein